jgi:DNA processing protein
MIYPPEHGALATRVAGHGALISEFAPGTRPEAHHFPLRNRIISGLSRAVVVIEASDRSGSLITARMALEQGRDVMAVPGNVLSGRSRGCHALIKDGARLVETVEDVLDELGWDPPAENSPEKSTNSCTVNSLATIMDPGEPYSLDQLETMTGRAASDLLATLADLELAGKVTRLPGGHFVRLDVRC